MSLLHEYYNTGDDTTIAVYGDYWPSQTFTATNTYDISSVKLKMFRTGSPGTLTVSIKAVDGNKKPTGSDLTSGTINANTFQTSVAAAIFEEITLTSYTIINGTEYAIVVRALNGNGSNCVNYREDNSSPAYTGGTGKWFSNDGGASWYEVTNRDYMFENYGGASVPVEKSYSKALVAMAANEVWYESSAGTMEELTAANADIETGNLLTACEALQKVFIANETNLKVIDFKNSKVTTADIKPTGKVVPIKGTVLTGGTSGASMITDFITASDSACTVYGYRTTTATFSNGETVTGTVTTANDVTFVTSAAEVAAPHWYSWTVYGADTTTYGIMPSQANLVCLYRGRLVLAGDKYYPHQWYMSRVINPWDWKYVVNDPLSPIRGGSADAGEIGDIIKALIPYRDDYLIVGCANSIWLMRGDPTAGGSIDPITDKTGMYGPRAWCFDDTNTLYFFGKNGLYSLTAGATQPPENISQVALPNWISDWDLDESSHRIVLSFDPIRRGILISKTALTDGTNSNYYYDLKIGGFYPESYPTACGMFSSVYYDATDNTYKKHLFGSTDGYIRYFLNSAKDDDAGASDTAISSYLVYPIIQMSEEDDKEGKLISLTFEVAGGASGGSFGDSDGFTYSLYIGNDAETLLEDIKDGATAFTTGSFSTTGRQNRIRTRVRSRWLGLKLSNSTATETWAINLVSGEMRPAGKIK